MKALVRHGEEDIHCLKVSDQEIEYGRDTIKVTSCAICGSDLNFFRHLVPAMRSGDIMGRESMGMAVEVGGAAKNTLKKGDRVIIPFTIRSAILIGAAQVIAIDPLPERLSMAAAASRGSRAA